MLLATQYSLRPPPSFPRSVAGISPSSAQTWASPTSQESLRYKRTARTQQMCCSQRDTPVQAGGRLRGKRGYDEVDGGITKLRQLPPALHRALIVAEWIVAPLQCECECESTSRAACHRSVPPMTSCAAHPSGTGCSRRNASCRIYADPTASTPVKRVHETRHTPSTRSTEASRQSAVRVVRAPVLHV